MQSTKLSSPQLPSDYRDFAREKDDCTYTPHEDTLSVYSSHNECHHHHHHQRQFRQFLFPILAGFLATFLLLLAIYTAIKICSTGSSGIGEEQGRGLLNIVGLVKRATDSASGNGNTFVHNKLYLIIVFVGLVLVVLAAIMLSAWCCRGSFENPLCCPCYLCACCGGLACLECIGCGLCAVGVEQV